MRGGITMIRVDSSNLSSISYEDGTLTVAFRNGRRYTYEGVEQEVYDTLVKTAATPDASVGKTFNALVRQGGYECEEIIDG